MKKYSYIGPVMSFDRILNYEWAGSTFAATENKAKNNLAYQYKCQYGLAPGAKIILPGKIREVETMEV